MMQILENTFYTSKQLEKEIHIADGVSAMIFDDENILETVTFGKGANLKYFSYFKATPLNPPLSMGETNNKENSPQDGGVYTKTFDISGQGSRCEVYSLLSSTGDKITARIEGKLTSSGSYLDMHIVSFVSDGGVIDLDGIVNIVEGVEQVEGYLVEENIFLGSTGKVRGLPTLLVHSNDVKASHACNMERISDDKLFYLRSRGLPREDATVLMIESYIAKIFGEIEAENEELYNEVKNSILERVK